MGHNGDKRLRKYTTLLVGGKWGGVGESCELVDELEGEFNLGIFGELMEPKLLEDRRVESINGGCFEDIPEDVSDYGLVIWMPEVSNSYKKKYPIRGKDTVFICSRLFSNDDSHEDLLAIINKLNADGLLVIGGEGQYKYKLFDYLLGCRIFSQDLNLIVGELRRFRSKFIISKLVREKYNL